MTSFEADLDPDSRAPRMRYNFANGWSASVVFLGGDRSGTRFRVASMACSPTGKWGQGLTELHEGEADANEVAAFLSVVARRERP